MREIVNTMFGTNTPIKIFAQIGLLFFLYLFTYYLYQGILNPIPPPGDSYTYHIPISLTILNGTFIQPTYFTPKLFMGIFNPGSSEAINSLFILLHIPLTLSNLIAIVVLLFCCFALARTFKIDYFFSLLFAVTICTLNAIDRWFIAVSMDVLMVIWFILAIILLEKPQKTLRYSLLLGAVSGMIIGSKYSGIGYLFFLFLVYWRVLLSIFSMRRFFIFLIPFSVLGIFWYVRNFLAVGNPMWPLCIFSLPCQGIWYNNHLQIWDTTLIYPIIMFNAFFSEYKLWGLSLFMVPFILYAKIKSNVKLPSRIVTLSLIGLLNFIILLPQPTSAQPWIMVSSFRYSYPAFIPLILSVFMLAQYYKKEVWVGYFSIASMLPVLTMQYLPKLLLLYFPLAIICFYIIQRFEPKTVKLKNSKKEL